MLRLPAAVGLVLLAAGCAAGSGMSPQGTVARESASVTDRCRPEGLYRSPGTAPPYCSVYDADGREDMGPDHPRRVVGYFTGWRTGTDGRDPYLVSDVPWDRITHLHYAFAHIDDGYRISVGDVDGPANPATGMSWPAEPSARLDPELPYAGHFNLLSRFREEHPGVKTLISVGGWAETGGYLDEDGDRVDTGGFYTMTTRPDGGVNAEGIATFARSVVDFLRRYGFDGVDIDYEYPTSMPDAGNPLDFGHANPLRPYLMRSYVELMRTLRTELDRAGEEDGRYYLLTAAVPASAYLLRGMEVFQVASYLDYVNLMTYDFHGSWNEHVGHHAPLFDTGEDAELEEAEIYRTPGYGGIGYLNADWAYHYYRGSLPPGRINLGIPYYTRGWQGVQGGRQGLWGRAPAPDPSLCPPGTGGSGRSACGYGAEGIDDLWAAAGGGDANEIAGGLNPLWHARNLEDGVVPGYLESFGLDPESEPGHRLTGDYELHYDAVAGASWLWNPEKDVFLSTEDRRSVQAKAGYVRERGLGGVALWELAGDYAWHPERREGRGEFHYGSTLTDAIHEELREAQPYATGMDDRPPPAEALDVSIELTGFGVGVDTYPLDPTLRITNRTGVDLPPGFEIRFDVPTSTPAGLAASTGSLRVLETGHDGPNNVGGLRGPYHRVSYRLPSCSGLAAGESHEFELLYALPFSGPASYRVGIGDREYAVGSDRPGIRPAALPDRDPAADDSC